MSYALPVSRASLSLQFNDDIANLTLKKYRKSIKNKKEIFSQVNMTERIPWYRSTCRLAAGMILLIDLGQLLVRNMSVDLGGRNIGMPKQLLD